MEGAERGHVVVGVHVAGERVDCSLPDCGGGCLGFCHGEIFDAEFCRKSCNGVYHWCVVYSNNAWGATAA